MHDDIVLTRTDMGENYICKACEVRHVKIVAVTKRTAAGNFGFFHVVITTLLVPLVLFIQLTEQELHAPDKRKAVFSKEDELHNKPAIHKKASKKKLVEA